ncbi:Guanylate kinase family protein [Tritrichomonas foetus]|uniref:guanylate kinase n=1 Tax=Tritrichomonas foetus TaxID=1144522 RepID=A0A1J4JI55_9EUKA|nr:Guanylate kinase family protein [Tritrichomonas foetus]|eukprot:OHS97267.1 Guanylate kinase family protein [Tritrichomonas foetus]
MILKIVEFFSLLIKMNCGPIVFVGPSGIGKGTIEKAIMGKNPERFAFSVSHTTRAPRPGETNGVEYNFIQRQDMEQEIKDGKFLEFCEIHGNLYGTSFAAIRTVTESGRICILDVNIDGALAIHKTDLKPFIIFLKPVSLEALEARLRGRGTETDEVIRVRMHTAEEELRRLEEHKNVFNLIIVNDKMEETIEAIHQGLKDHYGYDPLSK